MGELLVMQPCNALQSINELDTRTNFNCICHVCTYNGYKASLVCAHVIWFLVYVNVFILYLLNFILLTLFTSISHISNGNDYQMLFNTLTEFTVKYMYTHCNSIRRIGLFYPSLPLLPPSFVASFAVRKTIDNTFMLSIALSKC